MKMILIQPHKIDKDLCDDSGVLGLTYILSYLIKYGNFSKDNFKVVDASFQNILGEVKKERPDIVGISSMTITQNKAISLAKQIKEQYDIPIILGGVHISSTPYSFPDIFDVGVVGEGEQTMLELLNYFEKTGNLIDPNINGLVYNTKSGIHLTKKRNRIEPLDSIPIPKRTLLNPDFYYKPRPLWCGMKKITASLLTSRGCYYKCKFCYSNKMWEGIRFHSAEHVVEEIEILHNKLNIESISVWDDFFSCNEKRLKDILDLMKERNLVGEIRFDVQARANHINEETCKILKNMGVEYLNFGFESGSERMLKWLKGDSVSVTTNKRAVETANKNGLKVIGSLIFGSPYETIRDMEETLNFLEWLKNKADSIWFFAATPFPGTVFWDIAKQRGLVSEDMDWNKLSLINFDNPILLDNDVDKEKFKEIIKMAINKKTDYFDINNKLWKNRSLLMNLKALLSKPTTGVSKRRLISNLIKSRFHI